MGAASRGSSPGRAPPLRKCWGGRREAASNQIKRWPDGVLHPYCIAKSGARRAAGPFVLVGLASSGSWPCWRPQHTPRGLQCSWIPAFAGMTVDVLTVHPRLASPPRRRGPTCVDPRIGAHRCSARDFTCSDPRPLFASQRAKAPDRRAPRGALVRGLEGGWGRATIRPHFFGMGFAGARASAQSRKICN
jgi:hypothetical protein